MKLAFSTLGVPGLPLPDVARLARSHGWDGVELRAHPEEPLHVGASAAERALAVRVFVDAGVSVVGVTGYARVAADGPDEPVLSELSALVRLAADVGAPYARVFPGGGSLPPDAADAVAARRLGAVAPLAASLGVRVLLETHDSHARGRDAMRILGLVGHHNVGALWDVLHTWRGGETPAESVAALLPYLGYVQVKDVASRDDVTPVVVGGGVLPVAECVGVLKGVGYEGWLCWEWEGRWFAGSVEEFEGVAGVGLAYLRGLVGGGGGG
ncbi:sugar phosphate isomerase/epimerase [Streptomyces sp. AV19]|uniref:sugar phosphate isomerase/epimerase family protein n=1 Tax=Streptomyces sp. AV19 TaxID=2793068 RepID=UPI0018FE8F06|nr:sugar phosphate isomerase/epimerase family protein [Streptomyces sp. AV19]MBH1932955.1 sugar phosphate isomerase/epimerase [Streptomyces sp. AV19]MDG4531705.1 sugar phosphate isomerase/epimerase [Streptomyces sp. AV19]